MGRNRTLTRLAHRFYWSRMSDDVDLVPMHSGEDRIALLDDDLSQLSAVTGDSFHISALQKEDPVCITFSSWISSGTFPTWTEVKALCPELRWL